VLGGRGGYGGGLWHGSLKSFKVLGAIAV